MLLIIVILAITMAAVNSENKGATKRRSRGPVGGFRKPTITYMMRGR